MCTTHMTHNDLFLSNSMGFYDLHLYCTSNLLGYYRTEKFIISHIKNVCKNNMIYAEYFAKT